jgi:SAM-dependent methyltransferase
MTGSVVAAARAFDAIADRFDERFSPWRSVAAQRNAVRADLLAAFPPGATLIDIGGGTGEEAAWLADHGRQVLMTDAAPNMVRVATSKFAHRPLARAQVAAAEDFEHLAAARADESLFDGAYSNFAALNCVTELGPFARGLARMVRPGAPALLVLFGTACPGEVLVEGLRGRPRAMFRRLARGDVPARLGGHAFSVRYHRRRDVVAALQPWFTLRARRGIGVLVPPSAAEPWISRHPRLLGALEWTDRVVSRRCAGLGDHVLYHFVRTDVAA